MKIAVRFLGLPPSDAVRQFVERQVLFHLSRFAHEIEAIEIRVRDVNGPRGGDDMECRVTVKGPRLGHNTITDLDGDVYQAVGMAMSRAARAVARTLERARSLNPSLRLLS